MTCARQVLNRAALAAALLLVVVAPATSSLAEPGGLLALELRSYPEDPRDLVALLIPFLAKLNFAEKLPREPWPGGIVRAFLLGTSGDIIDLTGQRGCVVVVLEATLLPTGPEKRARSSRVQEFRTALHAFLGSLPTPRLSAKDVEWRLGIACEPVL